jgi:hypothetical protein
MGKMTQNGLEKVVATLQKVWANNPEILQPVAAFFNIDIDGRLNGKTDWKELTYPSY